MIRQKLGKKSLLRLMAWILAAVMIFSTVTYAAQDVPTGASADEVVVEDIDTAEAAEETAPDAAVEEAAEEAEAEEAVEEIEETGEDDAAVSEEAAEEEEDAAAEEAEEEEAAEPEEEAEEAAETEEEAAEAEETEEAAEPEEDAEAEEAEEVAEAEETVVETPAAMGVQIESFNGGRPILGVNGVNTYQLKFAVQADDISTFAFSSSDESILTVDEGGLLTAHAPGEAVIYAGLAEDPQAASLTVTVYDTVYRIVLNTNGGTLTDDSKEYMFKDSEGILAPAGEEVTLPTNILSYSDENYDFKGWTESGSDTAVKKHTPTADTTLYAKWANYYVVKFNANGGTFKDSYASYATTGRTVYKGNDLYLPYASSCMETRTGYKFEGWTVGKSGTKVYSQGDYYTPTKDVTLYAKWTAQYKVTFNTNGGKFKEGYESYKVRYVDPGDDFYLPYSYYLEDRTGYQFEGWTVKKNGTNVLTGYYTPTKSITLYAKWTKLYKVTFKSNGGKFNDGTTSYVRYVEPGSYTYLPYVSEYSDYNLKDRSSYILKGWTIGKDGTDVYNTYSSYTPTKDVTFYAKWAKAYTIKFNLNGGTTENTYNTQDRKVEVGYSTSLPIGENAATKTTSGKLYVVTGWSTSKSGTALSSNYYTPTKNITLYAKYDRAYKIKLNLNGGSWNDGYSYYGEDGVIWYDGKYLSLPGEYAASNGKKVLAGWSKTKGGDMIKPYTFSTTKDCTLYAVWKPKYTVKFNLNGGSWQNSGKDNYGSGTTWYEGRGYLDTPYEYYVKKDGYTLTGWSKTKGGEVIDTNYFSTTKNITLYAVWNKNYTVTYNANGGTWNSGYSKKETSYAGEQHYLPGSYVASKKNSIIVGWSPKKTGGTVYTSSYKVTKNVTLYAQWAKAYTVTLKANGGTFSDDTKTTTQTVQAGNIMELSAWDNYYGNMPTRSGYQLAGWTVKKNTGTVLRGEYKPTKNITLYAKWVKNVTLTFNANGGKFTDYDGNTSTTQKIIVASGQTIGTMSPSNPTLKNKVFLGWYLDKKGTKPLKKSASFTKATTVYAKWQAKPLKITVKGIKNGSLEYYVSGGYQYTNKITTTSFSYNIDKGDRIGYLYGSKSGYTAKFYLDSSYKKPVYTTYVPTADTTIYVKWFEYVTVTWDGNGGGRYYNVYEDGYQLRKMGSTSSYKSLMCENLPRAYEMRKDGYVFAGWYLALDSKQKVLPASHVFNKDVTVKAKWAKAVKITLKLNGGTMSSYYKGRYVPNFYAKKGEMIGKYTNYIPNPTRKGYTFKGWKNSVNGKVVSDLYSEKPTKATTYTAQWKKATTTSTKYVTVTIKGGAGSVYDPVKERYVATLKVKVPKNTTLENSGLDQYAPDHDERGKHLVASGWSKVKQNGTALKDTYKFTKNVTIFPIWKKYNLTVALVTNGGSYGGYAQNSPIVYSMAKNGKINLPDKTMMERESYTFVGWYSDAKLTKKLSNQKTYKVTKSGTYLFAKWKKK